MTEAVKPTKKAAPSFTFPHMTKRNIGESKERTYVPSPDTYFKKNMLKTT